MRNPLPYTVENFAAAVNAFRTAALLDDWPTFDSDLSRLAATLRDYQRLLTEVAGLREDRARLDWLNRNPPNREMKPMTSISRDQIDGAMAAARSSGRGNEID